MRHVFLCVGAVVTALALTGVPAGAFAQTPPPPPHSPAGIEAHSPSPTGTPGAAGVKTESPSPAATGERFIARLTGSQEAPPNTSPATGIARVTVNVGQSSVCWDLAVRKLEGHITGAHIHKGPPGENGPIVVPLSPSTGNLSKGCKTVTRTLADEIMAHPGSYYVNVHTSKFPDGEIRRWRAAP
jgi:hypothetical protein